MGGGCLIGGERLGGGQIGEMLCNERYQALVSKIAGSRDYKIRRGIDGRIVVPHHLRIETADGFTRSEDWLSKGMVFPEVRRENLMDQIIRAIRLHLDLFQNDALLLLYIGVGKARVQDEVRQNVKGQR